MSSIQILKLKPRKCLFCGANAQWATRQTERDETVIVWSCGQFICRIKAINWVSNTLLLHEEKAE